MSACDRVFERLTRGPFPGGPFPDGSSADPAEDARVERHLASCHECRRLAEALRPAVSLFHEALERTDDLPRYAGRLAEPREAAPRVLLAEPPHSSVRPSAANAPSRPQARLIDSARPAAENAAEPARTGLARPFDRNRVRDAVLCTVTIAASVAVALILAQFAGAPPMGERPVSAAVLSDADWSRFSGPVEIERAHAWSMPTGCVAVSNRPATGQIGSTQVACCTLCHAAGEEGDAVAHAVRAGREVAVRPALILSSCATCHY